MKIWPYMILSACLLALAVDVKSDVQNKTALKQTHSFSQSYVKPGAAVSLTHDYDGHTELGALETVTLSIDHLYEDGMLRAAILPSAGLDIISNMSPQQTQLSAGSVVQIYVQFSALKSGSYTLNVELIHEDRFGQHMRRTLSVPIQAGDADNQATSKTQRDVVDKVTSTGLIILPAQETIR